MFTSSPEQAKAYNRVEKLRDPSHVWALSLEELTGLFQEHDLRDKKTATFGLFMQLEELLIEVVRRVSCGERYAQHGNGAGQSEIDRVRNLLTCPSASSRANQRLKSVGPTSDGWAASWNHPFICPIVWPLASPTT